MDKNTFVNLISSVRGALFKVGLCEQMRFSGFVDDSAVDKQRIGKNTVLKRNPIKEDAFKFAAAKNTAFDGAAPAVCGPKARLYETGLRKIHSVQAAVGKFHLCGVEAGEIASLKVAVRKTGFRQIRLCLKKGGMPNGERFFRQSRQTFLPG